MEMNHNLPINRYSINFVYLDFDGEKQQYIAKVCAVSAQSAVAQLHKCANVCEVLEVEEVTCIENDIMAIKKVNPDGLKLSTVARTGKGFALSLKRDNKFGPTFAIIAGSEEALQEILKQIEPDTTVLETDKVKDMAVFEITGDD